MHTSSLEQGNACIQAIEQKLCICPVKRISQDVSYNLKGNKWNALQSLGSKEKFIH